MDLELLSGLSSRVGKPPPVLYYLIQSSVLGFGRVHVHFIKRVRYSREHDGIGDVL